MAIEKRVLLSARRDDPSPANVWALVAEQGGSLVLDLKYPYQDLHPQPGWQASLDGVDLEVTGVSGRQLTCVVKGGDL